MGHQAVGESHLTLGNRAAISDTAMQIFSEQGRKLWETDKRLSGCSTSCVPFKNLNTKQQPQTFLDMNIKKGNSILLSYVVKVFTPEKNIDE